MTHYNQCFATSLAQRGKYIVGSNDFQIARVLRTLRIENKYGKHEAYTRYQPIANQTMNKVEYDSEYKSRNKVVVIVEGCPALLGGRRRSRCLRHRRRR